MAVEQKRATIYFEPELHRAVRIKSAHTNRTISDIVNESLRIALSEDQEDLDAFEKRASEPVISYETLLAKLKADGKI
ncbi:MAG: CopG family transcriptional regulator [Pyrinomonadaceae bacterium]|nr:CopG family transcriptional regulator [Blastocatellia bacterium]MDQ3220570.1 CopG family transcriptional regulator [Acidobacteriota bacterium]MDQ3490461.1 CopG family transcriptional regulator [Acidobacteriota bacterium]